MKDVKSEIFQNAWVFKIHFSFWCFANFSFISVFVVSIYVSASMFSKLKNTDNWKFYFRKSVHPTNFWDWTRKQGGCPISGTTFHFLGWRKYRFSESFLTVYELHNYGTVIALTTHICVRRCLNISRYAYYKCPAADPALLFYCCSSHLFQSIHQRGRVHFQSQPRDFFLHVLLWEVSVFIYTSIWA